MLSFKIVVIAITALDYLAEFVANILNSAIVWIDNNTPAQNSFEVSCPSRLEVEAFD
jgi:hypothetical protein